MKNITVSVPEAVYQRARVRAAEQGRSVSALVAEFLCSMLERDTEFDRLEALQHRVQETITSFSGAERLAREQVHDRAVR